jgi:hypothetical protein
MKPGEFVGVDGQVDTALIYLLSVGTIEPDHPDFPAAVAALQALIQPKPTVPLAGVHPGVGLRWCGEKEPFEWTIGNKRYRMHDGIPQEFWGPVANWVWAGERADAFVQAGRRYERERGCAYVSDKPWTRQS